MATRILLAERLRKRTETIEFRAIRSRLMATAQDPNQKDTYRVLYLKPETIIMLQNEGICVEQIEEFGNKKYLLSWGITTERKLAGKIKWAVDFSERHISVPQKELEKAQKDANVKQLVTLGFHIQSAIA